MTILKIGAVLLGLGITFPTMVPTEHEQLSLLKTRHIQLERQWLECLGAHPKRYYFNTFDWVEVRCQILRTNVWGNPRKALR